MPLSEKEVLGALAALEESACLLRGQWYAERHFRHKGRIDLVTTMDVKIQQTLGAALGRVTPGVPLVAEEGNDGEPVFPERCWIVDPIDGTTNFVHGIPLVGITAAFWEHDGPVFGMTACPMLNETWWAVKGQGAFLNGRPVSVSAAEKLEDAVVATGFPYDIRETCDAVVARMAGVLPIAQGMRRMGAASLDLTYVACGRQDAYYESELHPWDYMAPRSVPGSASWQAMAVSTRNSWTPCMPATRGPRNSFQPRPARGALVRGEGSRKAPSVSARARSGATP